MVTASQVPAATSIGDVDFAALLQPGDGVVFAQACAEPLPLVQKLASQSGEILASVGQVQIFLGGSWSGLMTADMAQAFDYISYGAMGDGASLAKAGKLTVLPCHYSQLPRMIARRNIRADVVLLQLARNDQGRLSLSVANDYLLSALRHARVVVAEVNAQAPWTVGAEFPEDVEIDILIETDRPVLSIPAGISGSTASKIAARVASLVPQRATLQMGIGSLMGAVCEAISGLRGLRFHAGIMIDGIADLMAGGTVEHALTGSLLGTDRLFKFAHLNPAVQVLPLQMTHGPEVLLKIKRFCAINSAVEVDLTGQVNAEMNGNAYIGATGGQVDFHRAAASSEGGRAIIALPSTARGGMVSRIVPVLERVPVTTGRTDVDFIVTEWGYAQLKGLSLAKRAAAMAEIAAPEFRENLRAAAKHLY